MSVHHDDHDDDGAAAAEAAAAHLRLARHHALTARVGMALVRSTALHEMLQECAAATVRELEAALVRIWLFDPTQDALVLQASAGVDAVGGAGDAAGAEARIALGPSRIGSIAVERRPQVANLPNAGHNDSSVVDVKDAVAFVGYPLLLGQTLVGVIALTAHRRIPEDTLATLQQVADAVALGIKRLRTEAELRELAESLERRVAARTRELEESNKQLEAFSYSVAHDLRAPIRHIHGFAENLQRNAVDRLDSTGVHYLQTICAAARQAGTLIDDLLAFSRVGSTALKTREIALDLLLASVQHDIAIEALGRPVAWRIGPLPHVVADPDLLRLVLRHLLSNALKYTRPQPLPVIEVGAVVTADHVAVSVTDNGIGFDMQHVDKLFGVFHRLHNDDDYEGTGIGLASVRRIIHRHGGQTSASGVVGGGATFTFTLPLSLPLSRTPG